MGWTVYYSDSQCEGFYVMLFLPTTLPGVILVRPERHMDDRGYFARTFCEDEFTLAGITFAVRQANTSFNPHIKTLRGMHFQTSPKQEAKLVRCLTGKIYDVVVDLRKESPVYCHWHGVELSRKNGDALFIPEGCAHGFLTLTPDCEVLYLMGESYDASHADGVRWNDPAFGIDWPATPDLISSRDSTWLDYVP